MQKIVIVFTLSAIKDVITNCFPHENPINILLLLSLSSDVKSCIEIRDLTKYESVINVISMSLLVDFVSCKSKLMDSRYSSVCREFFYKYVLLMMVQLV